MVQRFKIKQAELEDALTGAGIPSAAQLAQRAELSKGTAERALRGDPVTRATVIKITGALKRHASEIFDRVEAGE